MLRFTKRGPQWAAAAAPRNLLEIQNVPQPRLTESETAGVEPSSGCFSKSPS